ncbi:GPP34 family phosphoprotein [Streptomyces sp. NPDC002328]|uniref:GPP34 family phosphoprotein n=1 Tax=Streptomyces sp. NPDC002328 TaxID=3364642 RepID=UPI00368B298B
MTTPRDLLIAALDAEAGGDPVPTGDLSLALAGAELIDLLTTAAVRLDDGRIVAGTYGPTPTDRLLEEAAASLATAEPFEPVGDFLWRRGENLAQTYLAAFEAEELVVRQGKNPLRKGRWALADSPSRRHATERAASAEPVLRTLAEEVGIGHRPAQGASGTRGASSAAGASATSDASYVDSEDAETVLAAVHDALLELEAVRQRRGIEQAAFDNIWRGLE